MTGAVNDDGSGTMTVQTPIEIEDIERILPHRYPFLLVDRILELDTLKRIVAIKNVTANEPFFQGHFPGRKIMPGVLILEAMAQAAALLNLAVDGHRGWLVYLAGVENARFRRPVVPGDTLRLEVDLIKMRGPFGMISGKALVGEEVAATAEIKFAIQEPTGIH
jgi:3-hydroxyacyl-[acyl-carrier-protein] dehydratase